MSPPPTLQCLLRTDASAQPQPLPCRPVACAFDAGGLAACPFAANGSFVRDPKGDPQEACADPFLEGARRSLMPP